ncbi:hypothetical protein [Paenibacillus eucommiae]|uniref:Uncharacterized protein n=1 Tax=Paenibacillus eucommiae TaxID=1355755 RepID=A0ABS4J8D9_9BACL|nr:hypothetical protein [Paenibacillus eucommiae]MBP1995009.1 hypothetical protein [Paenibacillus eucommiae]
MNFIFLISFLCIMALGMYYDAKKLKSQKKSIQITYYAIHALTLTLFVGKLMHISMPLPARFFIHTVSPWVGRLIGI